jgi:hypothetical protein
MRIQDTARFSLTLCLVMMVPSVAFAQASITGVVRDGSGGVLPGVVDLRPGAYSVTFTIPGFSTVRSEGIELSGSLTATVNADMRVGGVQKTITVTGQGSVVDVQGVTQQRVLDKEIVDALPSGRTATNLAVLIPGISLSTTFGGEGQDVSDVREELR